HGPLLRGHPVPFEKGAVVVACEEARLLALGALRSFEPGRSGFGAGLRLRLLTEREPDALEMPRVEAREHVALVLRLVCSACEQQPAFVLDDPRVVSRREARAPIRFVNASNSA